MGFRGPSRRTFNRLVLVTAGLTAAAGVTRADATEQDSADVDQPLQARPVGPAGRTAFLQIVAHPDDDLYFLNPDISDAVRTGAEVTTVVLTAAEADGVNGSGAPDRPGYVGARQHGLRSAYAAMAGLAPEAPWRRERIATRGGSAELHTLTDQPLVRLVFLDIEAGPALGAPGVNGTALMELWAGTRQTRPVLPPPGAVLAGATSYTREQLIGTLADLLAAFRPTVVRTLDPDPERRSPDPAEKPWLTDAGPYTDHQDHTAAARFAWAALYRHFETPAGAETLVDSYVGYGNARWRHNLGAGPIKEKLRYLGLYGWGDRRHCGDPVGCGDKNVGSSAAKTDWAQSANLRHPGTTDWLVPGRDGRLSAYAVTGGRVRRWTETAPGSGRFGRPADLGGGGLARHLTVARGQDGAVHLAALRVRVAGGTADAPAHELAVATDPGDGGPTVWQTLTVPPGPHTGLRTGVGNPVLAVDGDGVRHLFVRTGDQTVAWATRDASGDRPWTDWTDLGGSRVRDGLAVVSTRTGDLELFAPGEQTRRWAITGAGVSRAAGLPRPEELPLPPTGDALTLAPLSGDRLLLVTRSAATARLTTRIRPTPQAAWPARSADLDGADGFGVVAAHPHGAGVFLAQRGRAGLPEVIWQSDLSDPDPTPGADNADRRWLSGPRMVSRPALAATVAGTPVVAVIGPDGRLHTAPADPDEEATTLAWVSA